jgi:regulator of protease activity HflC (stomatin/prohibitin superfamily)
MAEIRRFPGFAHLRSEPTFHVLRHRCGELVASGRGLAFWFLPISSAIAEVPVDTRELPFLVQGKSNDFQEVTVQGDIQYRVTDPEELGTRIDFQIDLRTGLYQKAPLDRIASLLVGQAQQIAAELLPTESVRELLTAGPTRLRERLEAGLLGNTTIVDHGLEVLAVRVSDVSPAPDLDQALQTPTRERLQQEADQATFERRALAVEKERAIAENELQNQIELVRREQLLIDQQGSNERRRAEEDAAANGIRVEANADATRTHAAASAERIRMVQGARVEAEERRIAIYQSLPPAVIIGLAAKQLAGKLDTVEHLNITPDLLAAGLNNLLALGTSKLGES